jgi:hypothetical protein
MAVADHVGLQPDSVRALGTAFAEAGDGVGAVTTDCSTGGVVTGLSGTSVPDVCVTSARVAGIALQAISGHYGALGDRSKKAAATYEDAESVNVDFFRWS